jgi:hypothetical protein
VPISVLVAGSCKRTLFNLVRQIFGIDAPFEVSPNRSLRPVAVAVL